MKSRVIIRKAVMGDVSGIAETLIGLARSSGGFYPEPDLEWAYHRVITQIALNRAAVAENVAERIVGVIILDRSHFPWLHPDNSKGHFYSTDHFWVERGYRSFGTAEKLMSWAKRRADSERLRLHVQMFTPDETTHLKDRFVANQGFEYLGGNFIRDPKKPASSQQPTRPTHSQCDDQALAGESDG